MGLRFFTNDRMKQIDDAGLQQEQAEKAAALSGRGVPEDLKGTIYEDMAANNPYADMYYEPTFWDRIGLSNKAKDTNAEYQRLYNEYVAGIYDQKRQDEYNSPSEQVERMRLAGQNPDLLGTSGVSLTDEMNPNHSQPNPSLNGSAPAMSGFQMMTQVLGFATSAYQQISQIQGLSLDNILKDGSISDSFKPLIKDTITNQFARYFADSKRDGFADMPEWQGIEDVGASRYNKRQQKYYRRAFNEVLSSSWYQMQEKAYKDLDANNRAMKHFIGNYIDLELGALSSGYKATTSDNSYKNIVSSWRTQLYQDLYNDFKDGSVLAGLLLVGQSELLNNVVGSAGDVLNTLVDKIPSFKVFLHKRKK